MNKRVVMSLSSLIILFWFSKFGSAALGITPAIKEFNFEPNGIYVINYKVITDNYNGVFEPFVEGNLAKYVTLDKKKLTGEEQFTATISLPYEIETPGRNIITIGIKELPQGEGIISTMIFIKAVVYINVPYPGKYIEAKLEVPNGNVGEEIPVELTITNKGKENLTINAIIDFYDALGNKVSQMEFLPINLSTGSEKKVGKIIDSDKFEAGDYFAEATLDYGNIWPLKTNKTFRIGSLFVNITNFTTSLETGSIRKFLIDIESLWNSDIKEIYASVNVSNNTYSTEFKTSPIDLPAWQTRRLEGYLDTTEMEGTYDSQITLVYEGEKSTVKGKLEITKKEEEMISNNTLIIGIFVVLVIIVTYYLMKKTKKK